MSSLQQVLESGGFGVTAELAPPKGCDFREGIETAKQLAGLVHGINVTDMQSASLKASSLGFCIALKQAGLEPILQMTGRDRSRMAMLGDFLSAAAFGIDTVLALTGDHPSLGDCKASKPVFDLDSVGILRMLTSAEQTGTDCGGNALSSVPHFYKGATVTPVYEPLWLQLNKLRKKVDAGAQFVQTQAVFSADVLEEFMNAVERENIRVPVMAGIIPLKSAGMARYMNENVPGIRVPDGMMLRLSEAAEQGRAAGVKGLAAEAGIEMAAAEIAEIRRRGLCGGVHLMTLGAERRIPELLRRAGIG